MKNKSKSCSNFKRRELSQSEKILINKYNDIDDDKLIKENNDLKFTQYNKDFSIEEIEKKLDNNYTNIFPSNININSVNDSENKIKNILNKFNIKDTSDDIRIKEYNNNDKLRNNSKIQRTNENMKYFDNKSRISSKEIINKYINSQENIINSNNNIDNYTYYNTKNLSKTYGGNFLSNFNYINLTESLLNKTHNVIFPPKKTNLKNNSCCNIFNFKRIIDIEKNDTINEYNDIPKLLDMNKIICNNFNKNKKEKKKLNEKFRQNYSRIISAKKTKNKINKIDKENKENNSKCLNNNNNTKFKNNSNIKNYIKLSSSVKIIKPYKYISNKSIISKEKNNNNNKIKNKIFEIVEINKNKKKKNSQSEITVHKKQKIKENKNKNSSYNNKLKPELDEFKKSFFQYSSILSELIYKNKNNF